MKDTSTANAYADFDYLYYSTTRTAAVTGIYLSRTVDLGVTPTAAGSIAWVQSVPLGAYLGIQTRTSTDGIGWSNWTSPYPTPGGSPISSPLARYIQFSATMTENGSLQSPQLDSVTITFPGIAPKSPVVVSTEYQDSVWGNSKAVDVAWTEPLDTPAPVWAYYYAIDMPVMSGTAVSSSAVILSKTISGLPLSLGEGIHTFSLLSQGDPLEYPNSAPSILTIKKDTLPPDPVTISSLTHPTAAASANDSPIFDLAATDSVSATDLVSGVAGFVYVLDTLATSLPTGPYRRGREDSCRSASHPRDDGHASIRADGACPGRHDRSPHGDRPAAQDVLGDGFARDQQCRNRCDGAGQRSLSLPIQSTEAG